MKRIIPKNPNNKSPDRKSIIRDRALTGLGGAAMCGASIAIMRGLEPLSGGRDLLTFPAIIGSFALIYVVAAELQERFDNRNDGNGDGWSKRDPHEPESPYDPGGLGNNLMDQIEEYLRNHEPVLV